MRPKHNGCMKEQWTEASAAALLEEQSSSGQSKKEFCLLRGITPATFYYWQRRLRERDSGAGSGGFSALRLSAYRTIEVRLDDGRWLAVRSTDERELALVLKALSHA